MPCLRSNRKDRDDNSPDGSNSSGHTSEPLKCGLIVAISSEPVRAVGHGIVLYIAS
jgi:hypothetical protein